MPGKADPLVPPDRAGHGGGYPTGTGTLHIQHRNMSHGTASLPPAGARLSEVNKSLQGQPLNLGRISQPEHV